MSNNAVLTNIQYFQAYKEGWYIEKAIRTSSGYCCIWAQTTSYDWQITLHDDQFVEIATIGMDAMPSLDAPYTLEMLQYGSAATIGNRVFLNLTIATDEFSLARLGILVIDTVAGTLDRVLFPEVELEPSKSLGILATPSGKLVSYFNNSIYYSLDQGQSFTLLHQFSIDETYNSTNVNLYSIQDADVLAVNINSIVDTSNPVLPTTSNSLYTLNLNSGTVTPLVIPNHLDTNSTYAVGASNYNDETVYWASVKLGAHTIECRYHNGTHLIDSALVPTLLPNRNSGNLVILTPNNTTSSEIQYIDTYGHRSISNLAPNGAIPTSLYVTDTAAIGSSLDLSTLTNYVWASSIVQPVSTVYQLSQLMVEAVQLNKDIPLVPEARLTQFTATSIVGNNIDIASVPNISQLRYTVITSENVPYPEPAKLSQVKPVVITATSDPVIDPEPLLYSIQAETITDAQAPDYTKLHSMRQLVAQQELLPDTNVSIPNVIGLRLQVNHSKSQIQKAVGLYASAYECKRLYELHYTIDALDSWYITANIRIMHLDSSVPILVTITNDDGKVYSIPVTRTLILDCNLTSLTIVNTNSNVKANIVLNYGTF